MPSSLPSARMAALSDVDMVMEVAGVDESEAQALLDVTNGSAQLAIHLHFRAGVQRIPFVRRTLHESFNGVDDSFDAQMAREACAALFTAGRPLARPAARLWATPKWPKSHMGNTQEPQAALVPHCPIPPVVLSPETTAKVTELDYHHDERLFLGTTTTTVGDLARCRELLQEAQERWSRSLLTSCTSPHWGRGVALTDHRSDHKVPDGASSVADEAAALAKWLPHTRPCQVHAAGPHTSVEVATALNAINPLTPSIKPQGKRKLTDMGPPPPRPARRDGPEE